ncbi:MAG: RNA pseudouridine synthase, partial [Treponema sp.]|nr:RNA pseudouridine synthase [Treponema sp.]
FLEISLLTGRHHQIRAQLAARNLHVKGDLKYGGRRSEKNGGIRLHSFSLTFPHPAQPDKIIRIEGEPPVPDPLWEAFKASGPFPNSG